MMMKKNATLLLGWAGALSGVFMLVSGCSDEPPAGTGGGANASSSGTAGSGNGGEGGGATLCGNGMVDLMESCDTAIAAGMPGSCPTSCDDGASCTADTFMGAGTCGASCTHEVTITCQPGDGCCPSGCTVMNDSDCSSTCGNGTKEANEKCDTGIAPGMAGACSFNCNDGLACTNDLLLNPGTCGSECTHSELTTCIDGDGCCLPGCPMDSDCVVLSRIKQMVLTETGDEGWLRNGYWDGMAYANWTPWTGQGLTQLIAGQPMGQTYRSVDHVVLGDTTVQQSWVQLDGMKVWTHNGTWDGSAYSSWSPYTELVLDLPAGVSPIRSFDQVVLPDTRLKQTVVTFDGKTAYFRYADWDAATKKYINWTMWTNQYGDLTNASSFPAGGSFRSFNHVVLANNRIKQALLSEDGRTVWYRYGDWDGMKYATWTMWANQFGNLTSLVPGRGADQTYLSWEEGALAGAGVAAGCQNGCDDNDACTMDSCVGSSCVHVAKSCDDGNLCTEDSCVNGTCQNQAKNCDDGMGCTVDSCVNGECQHSANCDDSNGCTDDSCTGGSCQHTNNNASCGNGGTCQNGSCQSGGSSSGGPACTCTTGCKDSCGQPCNDGAMCANNAVCNGGNCVCNGGPFCLGNCCEPTRVCNPTGNSMYPCCTTASETCGSGTCGSVNLPGGCPSVWCGSCQTGKQCCNNRCIPSGETCN